ncbi:MAG: DUF1302 domain-containing protein [Pseudomonadota bacterium]|nr:DUF1302 domain-containing protein [Pseudomonadota bacterium]
MSNRYFFRFRASALATAVAAAFVGPAYGFEYKQGDFYMQVDTTVSVGASWRAEDRDYRQIGALNTFYVTGDRTDAHRHGSSTADNANLNWKKGSTFSEMLKVTMDVELNYRNFGAFIRGKAYYDHRIVNGDGVSDTPAYYQQIGNPFGSVVGNELEPNQSDGRSADIMDAFIWGDWYVNDMPLNVRLGRQVINWGEGIFFANGINSINPVDVNALLAPGSEVKDALIPLGSLYGSIGLTNSLTLEAFYMLEWKETELPACGTFFSPSDLVGPGCYNGFVPYGMELHAAPEPAVFTAPADWVTLPRVGDSEPDNGGEFGIALRYFADSIQTEFSFYYMNLHSRLPVISGHYANVDDFVAFFNSNPVLNPGGATLPQGMSLSDLRTTLVGATGNPLATAFLLPFGDYYLDYVEDIPLIGASFNTTFDFGLPGGATAVSGEISMRKDQPFALEDGDSLAGAVGLPALTCYDAPVPYDCYSKFEPGDQNVGYYETDYYQAEIAFIHFFDQILGASRWTAILDIAGSYTDLPAKDKALLNSSYNATLNFPNLPPVDQTIQGVVPIPYEDFLNSLALSIPNSAGSPEKNAYPTSGAWGYKMRFTGEYNNVFAGVNLKPTVSFSHDVYGYSASPVSNFLQNRKALGLSLEAIWLNDYSVQASYTSFYGNEPYNQLADKDYYSVSASASF